MTWNILFDRSKGIQKIGMDKIKVGVRIRPLIQNEMDQRLAIQWGHKEKSIYQIDPKTGRKIGNTFIFG